MHQRALAPVLIAAVACGCHSTRHVAAPPDVAFDAAVRSIVGMYNTRPTGADARARTFSAVMTDGFGNGYLNGSVRAAPHGSGGGSVVHVSYWTWGLDNLFLFPINRRHWEQDYLDLVTSTLESAPATQLAPG